MILNYDRKIFIEQATGVSIETLVARLSLSVNIFNVGSSILYFRTVKARKCVSRVYQQKKDFENSTFQEITS